MKNLRVQVIEVPTQGQGREDGNWPRDLLPWADPYIASLLGKLEKHSQGASDCPYSREDIKLYELAAQEWLGTDWNDASSETANIDDETTIAEMRPVFGGFPLLNDLDNDHPFGL